MDQAGRSVLALGSCRRTRGESRFHVVAYDFGIKRNILRRLVQSGMPRYGGAGRHDSRRRAGAETDGVFLSNGPGDPEPLEYQAAQVRKLVGRVPIFGICLGHQILGLALGGKTYKLKFGHRGRESSGAEQSNGTGGDHVAQSRVRGGSRIR